MSVKIILQRLVDNLQLRPTNRSRKNLSHFGSNYGGALPGVPLSHNQELCAALDDPVQFCLLTAQKQRSRNGGHAMALPGLRQLTPDQHESPIQWFNQKFNCRSRRVGIWDEVRHHGDRQIANYSKLQIGQAYLVHERLETLDQWSQNRGNAIRKTTWIHRCRIVIPSIISPRGTTVYGDEIHIEQPASAHFLQREGWRCWMHKQFCENKPRSKIGKIKAFDSESVEVYHLTGITDAGLRAWPFLINWTMDSLDLFERISL